MYVMKYQLVLFNWESIVQTFHIEVMSYIPQYFVQLVAQFTKMPLDMAHIHCKDSNKDTNKICTIRKGGRM
jgi:hypothetical protein